ncbi:hypothetical protein Glove_217g64 [Diversispora epigaea]|uniref:AMP-dependent synthetase/ligase domain-containing protein n=1 Tax=Diversispora epigaea TaxID=1348612 RepID=A0A397IGT6_9GLOM|nr:hypothetical protein Glove_217g64 [Diversispora epigaea]
MESIDNPDKFWARHGNIAWFQGELKAAYNSDEPDQGRKVTCGELLRDVCHLANVLKSYGVKKGDTHGYLYANGTRSGIKRAIIIHGPLANGATTVLFESTPLYPSPSRYWEPVKNTLLLNFIPHLPPFDYYAKNISIIVASLPGDLPTKLGSVVYPFFGIDPVTGEEINDTEAEDGVGRDKDGYYWIRGRVDDVINVSGHCLSTAEIESALLIHSSVAEAAWLEFMMM